MHIDSLISRLVKLKDVYNYFMKRKLFLLFLLLTSVTYQSYSQTTNNFVGSWEGILKVGVDLR